MKHLGRDRRALKALLDVEQRPQPRVLLLQQLVALHDRRLGEQLLPERGVVSGERGLRGKVACDLDEHFTGKLHGALQRVEHDRHRVPHTLEIAIARVGKQKSQREQPEEGEPRERRGTAMEEWWRLDRDVTHRDLTVSAMRSAPPHPTFSAHAEKRQGLRTARAGYGVTAACASPLSTLSRR